MKPLKGHKFQENWDKIKDQTYKLQKYVMYRYFRYPVYFWIVWRWRFNAISQIQWGIHKNEDQKCPITILKLMPHGELTSNYWTYKVIIETFI